jgi:hypothetical protein
MNIRITIILFVGLIASLAACKNKDLPSPVIPKADVSLVNATADTLNFAVNGTRQNNFSPIYSGGAYGLYIISGTQNYQVKKDSKPDVLFSGTYTLLDTSKTIKSDTLTVHYHYSFFIAGTSADQTFIKFNSTDSAGVILSRDKTNTTAMIRFVHAASTIGPLDVIIDKGDTAKVTNFYYKSSSRYFRVTDGIRTVKVTVHGEASPVLDTTLTLEQGSIYTFFAKGIRNGKGSNAFSVNLMTDNLVNTQ